MAYLLFQVSVVCCARARARAWCSSWGRRVSWRPPRAAVVHWSRTGQARQVAVSNLTTITSVSRWRAGLHVALVWPCGQLTWRVCQSTVNAVLSNPSPARAWREVSSNAGVTRVSPNWRCAWSSTSARGVAGVQVVLGGQQVASGQLAVDRGGHLHVRHGRGGGRHVGDQVRSPRVGLTRFRVHSGLGLVLVLSGVLSGVLPWSAVSLAVSQVSVRWSL